MHLSVNGITRLTAVTYLTVLGRQEVHSSVGSPSDSRKKWFITLFPLMRFLNVPFETTEPL